MSIEILESDRAALAATEASFAPPKIALTDQVMAMRTRALSAGQAPTMADLDQIIVLLNALTVPSNALRKAARTAAADLAAWTVALMNLTDAQVTEMSKNPGRFWGAGYLAMVNSLLFFSREDALKIASMATPDLTRDINNAFDDQAAGVTPDTTPPRLATIYDSGGTLDLVEQALRDSEVPATPLQVIDEAISAIVTLVSFGLLPNQDDPDSPLSKLKQLRERIVPAAQLAAPAANVLAP